MTYFVFVDFENVQKVDLALIEGKPVHVTLLIGKNQTWLDLALVQQIRRLPNQVELLEVGASGHNALDLTLAHYLGRAVERIPEATYGIVSKDKDFDPMIAHLVSRGIQVVRKDSFAGLLFLAPTKSASAPKPKPPLRVVSAKPAKTADKPAPSGRTPAPAPRPGTASGKGGKSDAAAEKFARLVKHLRNSPPATRLKLEHMIAAYYKSSLPAGGVPGVIDMLVRQGIALVDSAGKVAVI
jgi:hypothetical protein